MAPEDGSHDDRVDFIEGGGSGGIQRVQLYWPGRGEPAALVVAAETDGGGRVCKELNTSGSEMTES